MHLNRDFIQHVVTEATFYGLLPLDREFCFSFSAAQGCVVIAQDTASVREQFQNARSEGALGFLCALDKVLPEMYENNNLTIISVPDVDEALFRLAHAWRAKFSIPIVGVTGSFGKTSVVRLIANIMEEDGIKVYFTKDHMQTSRQLWVAILGLKTSHQAAVFEVNVTNRGSMKRLVQSLRPTTAVITGVGYANLQGLGSLEDAVFEMRQIFDEFEESGVGIIHGDQSLLARAGYTHPVIKFGSKTTNQVQARKVQVNDKSIEFVLKLYGEKYHIKLHGSHERKVHNALAACSVAHHLKIPLSAIIKGIERPVDVQSCFQFLPAKRGGSTVIDDTASLSPESTRASLFAFNELKTGRKKILVLSDMPALGVNAPFWHRQIGRCIRKLGGIDHIILVGRLVTWVQKVLPMSCKVSVVKNWQEAAHFIDGFSGDSYILIKGDRTQQFDKLIKTLSL